ncbi:MAG: zinc ribbon domain-containing protein [Blautia sp.]|nr:zinc ribbon domain-containing protein [Blautia sp.]
MVISEDAFNCPNCGAPINGDLCPYCGTAFIDWSAIDVHKPNWIKIKLDNKTVLVKAILEEASTHYGCPEPLAIYSNERILYPKMNSNIIIESTFSCIPFKMPGSTNEVLSIEINKNTADIQKAGEILHEIISKGS